jgi:hypothetical protein
LHCQPKISEKCEFVTLRKLENYQGKWIYTCGCLMPNTWVNGLHKRFSHGRLFFLDFQRRLFNILLVKIILKNSSVLDVLVPNLITYKFKQTSKTTIKAI